MKRIQCPCCGYFTIESDDEVIVDICEVCGWQYDWVAYKYPDKIIGPNGISLNDAKKNYKMFKVCCKGLIKSEWREPFCDELPENNI